MFRAAAAICSSRRYWILQRGIAERVVNVVSAQAAHVRLSPDSRHSVASRRSATKSADARRGAADDDELRQAAPPGGCSRTFTTVRANSAESPIPEK
jgi:hypothetical protein